MYHVIKVQQVIERKQFFSPPFLVTVTLTLTHVVCTTYKQISAKYRHFDTIFSGNCFSILGNSGIDLDTTGPLPK